MAQLAQNKKSILQLPTGSCFLICFLFFAFFSLIIRPLPCSLVSLFQNKSTLRNLSDENEFCMQFHFHANQSHFHKNSFALRLALKQRYKGTRKWPIISNHILSKTELAPVIWKPYLFPFPRASKMLISKPVFSRQVVRLWWISVLLHYKANLTLREYLVRLLSSNLAVFCPWNQNVGLTYLEYSPHSWLEWHIQYTCLR